MDVQALAEYPGAVRSRTTGAINPFGGLFVLMMLMSTYDKSGLALPFGGRDVSLTAYKLIFIALALWVTADLLIRPLPARVRVDHGLLKLVIAFVFLQTAASLLGGLIAPGGFPISAEIYYFIQRAHFLFIPLFALKLRLSPRSVLGLLLGAALIHYAFVALQFISPSTYSEFAQSVADPLRRDNALGWSGETLDFIGLQTTSNYGAFAAAFGFLALAFRARNPLARYATWAMGWLAAVMAVLSPSRAVFIMMVITLLVFLMRTRALSKLQLSVGVILVGAIVGGAMLLGQPELPQIGAVYAFVDPERSAVWGSDVGKLIILESSPEMVARSPVFGWGQGRFTDIADAQGLGGIVAEYSHFHILSVLLSSGVVGLLAEIAVTVGIARALWRRKERAYAVMAAIFIGVSLYGLLYDAGHLDIFACFNGTAAYWALRSVSPRPPSVEV
jgi:O-antigen ligase/polysaccharide polymerase Wzy-like membrane protein